MSSCSLCFAGAILILLVSTLNVNFVSGASIGETHVRNRDSNNHVALPFNANPRKRRIETLATALGNFSCRKFPNVIAEALILLILIVMCQGVKQALNSTERVA